VVVKLRGIFHTERAKCKERQLDELLRHGIDDINQYLNKRIEMCAKMLHP